MCRQIRMILSFFRQAHMIIQKTARCSIQQVQTACKESPLFLSFFSFHHVPLILQLFFQITSHNIGKIFNAADIRKIFAKNPAFCQKILFLPGKNTQHRYTGISQMAYLHRRIFCPVITKICSGVAAVRTVDYDIIWSAVAEYNENPVFFRPLQKSRCRRTHGQTVPVV